MELGGYSSLAAAALPFLEATASGHRGLVVVREAYDRMRFLVGQRPVRLRRLAAAAAPETFPSSDLAALAAALEKEIEEDGATAVFFEGVDFLVQTHGIDTVVDWLHRLDELGRARGVHLWVHLPERQLLLEQAARLRREFPAESSSTLRP